MILLLGVCAMVVSGAALANEQALTADGYLTLRPDQVAVIHFDPQGKIVVDQITSSTADKPQTQPDHLVLTFSASGPSGGASLTVKSGYANGFNYHARMRLRGVVQPTSVCPIIPKGSGYEMWQNKLDGVEVGGFTAAQMNELRCQ